MTRTLICMEKVNPIALSEKTGVPIGHTEKILKQMVEDHKERRRRHSPPPPVGSIALRVAERKYGIPSSTLCRWVKRGLIPIIDRTKNWLYVDETHLVRIVALYNTNPGQGKRTLQLTEKVIAAQ